MPSGDPENPSRPVAVVALGGNALAAPGAPMTVAHQQAMVEVAAAVLAPLLGRFRLVVTHGNGPQVGAFAEASHAAADFADAELDTLNAETDGMIGYALVQALGNEVSAHVVAVLTRVEVAADDPAMARPTKPVGPVLDHADAARLRSTRGWVVEPRGVGLRRVVPSPEPVEILELAAIRTLVGSGFVTVCGGGGGIPVVRRADGRSVGIDAVVDKDLTSSLLAQRLDADVLLLLTDVAAVIDGFGTSGASEIRSIAATELRSMDLEAGSMGPKAEAACRFAAATGRPAFIGRLRDAARIIDGAAGTRVGP